MRNDNAALTEKTVPDPVPNPPASMSLFRYSPGLILVCIAIADSIRLPPPDLWWHIRFGQAVLSLHHLVLFDPYSYSAAGHYWNNHEWLAEVLMAAIFNHAGAFGLILLKLACTAIVIIALAAALAETGSSTLVQFAVLIGAAVVIKPQYPVSSAIIHVRAAGGADLPAHVGRLSARRDAYGWRFRYLRYGRICTAYSSWASLLSALTAAVSGLQDVMVGRGYDRAIRLAAITVAATLATLATPYGFGNWEMVAHALQNPYTRIVIVEWQPLATAALEQWQQHKFVISNYDIAIAMMAATGHFVGADNRSCRLAVIRDSSW